MQPFGSNLLFSPAPLLLLLSPAPRSPLLYFLHHHLYFPLCTTTTSPTVPAFTSHPLNLTFLTLIRLLFVAVHICMQPVVFSPHTRLPLQRHQPNGLEFITFPPSVPTPSWVFRENFKQIISGISNGIKMSQIPIHGQLTGYLATSWYIAIYCFLFHDPSVSCLSVQHNSYWSQSELTLQVLFCEMLPNSL